MIGANGITHDVYEVIVWIQHMFLRYNVMKQRWAMTHPS